MTNFRPHIICILLCLLSIVSVVANNASTTPFDATIEQMLNICKTYESAAQSGNKEAQYQCGLMYLKIGLLYWDHCVYYDDSVLPDGYYGRGMYEINANKKRRTYALPYICQAADYGIVDAQYIAGKFLFEHARDIHIGQYQSDTKEYRSAQRQTENRGIQYLKNATRQQHANAADKLGEIGFEHPNEYITELQSYICNLLATKLSNQHPGAFYRVGKYLENGVDTIPADITKAIEYYSIAADSGHYLAAKRLARIYRKGVNNVTRNYSLAKHWEDVAEQNEPATSIVTRIGILIIDLIIFFGLLFIGIKISNFYSQKISKVWELLTSKAQLSTTEISIVKIFSSILSIITIIGIIVLFYNFVIQCAGHAMNSDELYDLPHFLNPFKGL